MAENRIETDQQLEPLIAELEHNAKLYSTAADNALNDQLRQLFEARAKQRQEFAEALRRRTWSTAEEEENGRGPLDVLQRGSLTIRATMTIEPDKTDRLLIEDTREATQPLIEKYRELLAATENEEPRLHAALQRQYAQLQAAQSNLATLLGAPGSQMALALFPTVDQAEQAVLLLKENDFSRESINILAHEDAVKSLMHDRRPETTKESATAGAVGGSAVGGLIGLVAGASTAVVMGLGTVLTGGALAVALGITAAGAGIGASYGGLLGALMGWGVSEGDVQHFVEGVRDGSILVAVETDRARNDDALRFMREAGASYASAHEEPSEPAG